MIDLPTKAGAVIRWKYNYDGIFQYQVAVLSIHPDYEQGLVWYRCGRTDPWLPERMQATIDSAWGKWEIIHAGEADE